MAKIVFGGGQTLAVEGTPQDVRNNTLQPPPSVAPFVPMKNGDETYLVNPGQIAYIETDVPQEAVLDAAVFQ